MKQGVQTSEFGLTIAYLVAAVVLFYLKAPMELILALAIPTTGYGVSRGLSKSGNGGN